MSTVYCTRAFGGSTMSEAAWESITDDALQTILDGLKDIVEGARRERGTEETDLAIVAIVEVATHSFSIVGSTRAKAAALLPDTDLSHVTLKDSLRAHKPPKIPILFLGLDDAAAVLFAQTGAAIYTGGAPVTTGGEA